MCNLLAKLVLSLVCLFQAQAFGYSASGSEVFEEYPGDFGWPEQVFPGYSSLSIEWLKQLIESNDVQSIEQLLPLLPEGLRSSYTLVRNTNSLQDADDINPRVIMFAPDARFVIAFNGASYQRRFQQVEILDYTAEDGSARFFEVDFSKPKAELSSANPAVCMTCHASFPRPNGEPKPIWTNYSRWFGAYGETDDRMDQVQRDRYSQFLNHASNHDRYKWLVRESEKSKFAPYYASTSYDVNAEERGLSGRYLDNGLSMTMRNPMFMPNLRLSKTLDARNSVRIAKHIMRSDLYLDFPFTTLFSVACDNKGRRSRPANKLELLPDNAPSFVSYDFGLDQNDFTILFADSQADYNNGNHHFGTRALIAGYLAKQVLETASDPELKKWFRPSYWIDYYGSFGISRSEELYETETYKYLWSWGYLLDSLVPGFSTTSYLSVTMKDLDLPDNAEGVPYDQFCVEMANRAIQEARGKEDKIAFARNYRGRFIDSFYGERTIKDREQRSLPVVLQECADCHDSSEPGVDFAPYIPFASPEALAFMIQSEQRGDRNRLVEKVSQRISNEFRSAHVGGGQMPLGRRALDEEESASLIDYLEGLAGN